MAEDSSKELFEFFQKMWNPLSFPIPGMFQPTMSVEEVEKKIELILADAKGQPVTEPFEEDESDSGEESAE